MLNFAFIITAYMQLDLTRENIRRIREFPNLGTAKIVVVSTSEDDPGFSEIPDVDFIHFKDAPGSKNSLYESYPQHYWNWHHQFLPQRIIRSIGLAARHLNQEGIQYALHAHSDTFWVDESLLLKELLRMDSESLIALGDLTLPLENSRNLPEGFFFNPEGMLFNVDFAKTFGDMFNFNETEFRSNNYGCTENLIGQYAHWFLTGKIISGRDDPVENIYREKVKSRCIRDYHGDFGHLINLAGMQPASPQ